jgi:hypothetical protein
MATITDVRAPAPPAPPTTTPTRRARLVPRLGALLALAGVLIPLLLFVRLAMNTTVNFDGGMNLQVAQNLAEGDGYARDYEVHEEFPSEVQTGGAFLAVAAGAIRVLGGTQLAYQFASIAFVAIFLVVVSWAVGPNRWARLAAPGLVLLAVPYITVFAVGALGEVPVAALSLAALVLLARVVSGGTHPYRDVALAAGAIGVAITIKVIAVAALPVLVLGIVLARRMRPELSRWRLAAAGLAVVVGQALFELYRLVSLGTSGFSSYWEDAMPRIGSEAGTTNRGGGGGGGILQNLGDHVEALADSTGLGTSTVVLAAYLVVPFAVLAWLTVVHRKAIGSWLRDRTFVLSVLVASYAGVFLLWWLLATPLEKAWLRRAVVALLALNLLYALLAVHLLRRRTPRRRAGPVAAAVALGCLALAGGMFAWPVLAREAPRTMNLDGTPLANYERAADAVRAGTESGEHRYYGQGWWSAPTISLMADVPLENAYKTPVCEFDRTRDVLVWDSDAEGFGKLDDRGGRLRLVKVANFGGSVWLYSLGPAPGVCGTTSAGT